MTTREQDLAIREADTELSDLRRACREGWRHAAELEEERKRLQAELARPVSSEVSTLLAERSKLIWENKHIKAENEALQKDAERYQWLRARLPGSTYRVMGVIYSEGGAGVDDAIDAAMKGTP